MIKYNLTNMIIGIVILLLALKIFGKKDLQKGMKEGDDKSQSQCIIRDGITICPNHTGYSPYYYPWWFYRYPYHRTYHGFARPYRHRYGRHYRH